MSNGTYYVQECPTCGRSLQIRVAYLGKRVTCQHCAAQFNASDPSSAESLPSESVILARADELLESLQNAAASSGSATSSSSTVGQC